jgi:MFS family permease
MNVRAVRTSLSTLLRGRDGSQEEKNARNLILSGAWLGFIDAGILTYLGVYLARIGATPTTLGLLSSGPQLINMLVLLPAGAFVERQTDLVRFSNRIAVVHRSHFLLIALLPFFLSQSDIAAGAIIIWSLSAIFSAMYLPAFMAVIQRSVSPQMMPRVNGSRWALYSVVGAILIPAFGIMTDHLTFPTGYQIAFALSFFGALPNIFFFAKVRTPPFVAERSTADAARPLRARLAEVTRPFLESKRFVRFNLATAFFRVSLGIPAGLFSIFWVDNLHATDTWIGIRGAVAYASLVVGYSLWGRVAGRVGHRSLLLIASLIGLYPIATALSPTVEWMVLAAILWGVFVAAIDIGIVDMLLAACPEGRQPSFIAAANVLGSLELFIAPLLGALLAQVFGVQTALIVSGVMQIVSGAFFLLLPSHAEEKRDHAERQAALQVDV